MRHTDTQHETIYYLNWVSVASWVHIYIHTHTNTCGPFCVSRWRISSALQNWLRVISCLINGRVAEMIFNGLIKEIQPKIRINPVRRPHKFALFIAASTLRNFQVNADLWVSSVYRSRSIQFARNRNDVFCSKGNTRSAISNLQKLCGTVAPAIRFNDKRIRAGKNRKTHTTNIYLLNSVFSRENLPVPTVAFCAGDFLHSAMRPSNEWNTLLKSALIRALRNAEKKGKHGRY